MIPTAQQLAAAVAGVTARQPLPRFVSYLRVSTQKQGASGLGIEAQREAVGRHVRGVGGILVAEFVDVESGKNNARPQLTAALAHAKATGTTLAIAKLDRLSRNVAFIAALMESGVDFLACDMPMANKLTIHVLAAVAEHEREAISARTKAALAVVRASIADNGRWVAKSGRVISRLGGPNGAACLRGLGNDRAMIAVKARADAHAGQVTPVIDALRAEGITSLKALARALNQRGILAPRGGTWQATSVRNLLARSL